MAQIKAEKQEAYEWLMNIPTNKWCKHAFPFYSRCDVLMNNLSESFNATILLQREGITPINGQNKWPKTNDPVILPPEYKRGPGRPKKLRRREQNEANQPRWRRTNTTHRCKRCLQYGHNARTCKLPDPKKKTSNTEANVNTSLAIVPLNAYNVQLPTQSSQTTATKKG
ncbi:hypothetical protein MTR_3g436320 [Medicago truncatula]|uniref:Transcription factor interactor and regulator CCHC(Zn) family n=1 Tax=Medicago truncatula TaxID=3880 RepID=A0A072V5C6_MEDTR|nr:hypothetical protein MTR_3g436320 [Medicago truncatula]